MGCDLYEMVSCIRNVTLHFIQTVLYKYVKKKLKNISYVQLLVFSFNNSSPLQEMHSKYKCACAAFLKCTFFFQFDNFKGFSSSTIEQLCSVMFLSEILVEKVWSY